MGSGNSTGRAWPAAALGCPQTKLLHNFMACQHASAWNARLYRSHHQQIRWLSRQTAGGPANEIRDNLKISWDKTVEDFPDCVGQCSWLSPNHIQPAMASNPTVAHVISQGSWTLSGKLNFPHTWAALSHILRGYYPLWNARAPDWL